MVSVAGIKNRIDAVREKIGREVTFYTVANDSDRYYPASGYYDPRTYTGFSPVLEETNVLARVHWAGDERITMAPGGKYYVGDCTLTIDPSYHALAQKLMADAAKVVVDGRELKVTRIDPLGVPEINRIRLVCKSIGEQPPAIE